MWANVSLTSYMMIDVKCWQDILHGLNFDEVQQMLLSAVSLITLAELVNDTTVMFSMIIQTETFTGLWLEHVCLDDSSVTACQCAAHSNKQNRSQAKVCVSEDQRRRWYAGGSFRFTQTKWKKRWRVTWKPFLFHLNLLFWQRAFRGLINAWSETLVNVTLSFLCLHCAPLVLDGAAVFIRALLLLTDRQDDGCTSRLCELQLLSLSRAQLLHRTVLLSSLPGEADTRRKHVWGHTQQGAAPLQVGSGCCWVHAHHRFHYMLIWRWQQQQTEQTHSHSQQQLAACTAFSSITDHYSTIYCDTVKVLWCKRIQISSYQYFNSVRQNSQK